MGVELNQVKKRFVAPDGGVVPVIDIDHFFLRDNEQVALVGGGGSGKTTLLHLIAGILTADSGTIRFGRDDEFGGSSASGAGTGGGASVATMPVSTHQNIIDTTRLSEAQRDVFRGRFIGYVFQTHHLLGGFTAMENVMLGLSFTGRAKDAAWAKHLLTEVGLEQRLDYRPGKLSVGQQQRVAIARALVNRPKLVLADEPTGALDPKSAQQALVLIRRLCEEVGASLLLVSHDPQITGQFQRVVSLLELNRAM